MTHIHRLGVWFSLLLFLLLVVLSLSAGWTGIDPDNRWGLFRRVVLALGFAGLLVMALLFLARTLDRWLLSRRPSKEDSPFGEARHHRVPSATPRTPASIVPAARRRRETWILSAAVVLTMSVIGLTYVGLQSVWRWDEWPASTTYYVMLGESFTQGKTHLPIKPPPELTSSSDPYHSWTGLGGIVNLSLYQGKYYMYWGPTPAVAVALLRAAGIRISGDHIIVFAAGCMVFLFSALTILRLRSTYYPALPLWLTIVGVTLVGTVHPLLWFQNSPSVTEAAIVSGQAFLLAGVYFMVKGLTDDAPRLWNYFAVGAFWGLAVTSRLTSAISVATLILGAAMLWWKARPGMFRPKVAVSRLAALLAPLMLLVGSYAWYNLERFGNPLETGLTYQLVGINPNDQLARGTFFSSRYVAPNILYYAWAPIRPIPSFPYLRAGYSAYTPFNQLLQRLEVPNDYTVEDASGLVFAAPALVFALIFALSRLYDMIPRRSYKDRKLPGSEGAMPAGEGGLGVLLLLGGLAGSVPVLLFFATMTRYQMDFVPLLAIVSVLGMWRLHRDTRNLPFSGPVAAGFIVAMVLGTALVSLLLAVSGAGSRFDNINPDLLKFLVDILPHR